MRTETGIIEHLRGGVARDADARLRGSKGSKMTNPMPISAFLRKLPSIHSKIAPVAPSNPHKFPYRDPPWEQLESCLFDGPSSISKFAWMDKSFLNNLRRLLEDSELIGGLLKATVSWNSNGDDFSIRDTTVFATHVAPKYFNMFSISTFELVAQSWGFTSESDQKRGVVTFKHPDFKYDPSKYQGANIQQMKDPALETRPRSEPSVSFRKKPRDALQLLAATASASSEPTREESTSLGTLKAVEKKSKKSAISAKPSVVKARRSSLSSLLSPSLDRKVPVTFEMTPRNSLRRSIDQNMTPSDSTSISLALLKSRRKSYPLTPPGLSKMPSFSGVRLPRNPLASVVGAPKLGGAGEDELGKQVRLLTAQASLTSSLRLLVESPIGAYAAPPATPSCRPFLENLRAILERAEQGRFTHIVSWMHHGRSFRIYHENEFTQVVYPRSTDGSPLTNVMETLKEYGFIKLSKGKDKESYFHPLFARDLPMLGCGKTTQQWKEAGWKGDCTPEFFL